MNIKDEDWTALKQHIASAAVPWTFSNPLLMKMAQMEKSNGSVQQIDSVPHHGDTGNPRSDMGNQNRRSK